MVLNSKGGSGKSTVATSIASYYAAQGNKVMLVDLQP
jgi:chromosome partitioning protein